MYTNLRESGVQTTVIAAPRRCGGVLPAVWVLGLASTPVVQTLSFQRFNTSPPLFWLA